MLRPRKFIAAAGLAALCTTTLVALPGTSGAKTLAPVKIGFVTEETGTGNLYPYLRAVSNGVAKYVNAHGGIREINCARNLISAGIVANIGGTPQYSSATIDALMLGAGIPQINAGGTSVQDFAQSNQFTMSAGKAAGYDASLLELKAEHINSIYMDVVAAPAGTTSEALVKAAAAYVGIAVKGVSDVPTTASVFTPYVQAAISSGAGAVMSILPTTLLEPLISAYNQLGQYQIITGTPANNLTHTQLAAISGKENGYLQGGLTFPPPSATSKFPILKQFNSQMKAECNSGDQYACPGWTYNTSSVGQWMALQAFITIASKLKTITAASVLRGFQTAKRLTLGGLIPPWTPNKSAGFVGFPRISNPYAYEGVIKNNDQYLISSKLVNVKALNNLS